MSEQVGRKRMILVVAPLLGVGYIIQGVAKDPGLLNTGRFISGVAGGLACGPGAVNHKVLIREKHNIILLITIFICICIYIYKSF